MQLNSLFLQTAAPGPGGLGGGSMQIVLLVGMVAVMYFFMIRPQSKRAKEQKKFGEGINSGEKIITTAGIHGTISRMNDDGTIQVEISRGNFITIERSAISMEMTMNHRKKLDGTATTAGKVS